GAHLGDRAGGRLVEQVVVYGDPRHRDVAGVGHHEAGPDDLAHLAECGAVGRLVDLEAGGVRLGGDRDRGGRRGDPLPGGRHAPGGGGVDDLPGVDVVLGGGAGTGAGHRLAGGELGGRAVGRCVEERVLD